jgi:CheY-like chemotaxis protein
MNELKSSFIANMSHEIRTPLTGIIGFADILRDEVVGDEAREHVQYIHSNGRRLLETLDSVLDLARLDADQIHLDPTPLEVRTFAEETLALFERRAEDQGLDLTLEADEALGTVRVDESALQRILTNLVGNAIKFTEEGHVRVLLGIEAPETAPEDGRRLRLTVADTGRGMDAAFQERLFQEFTQQQSGMTRSHEGAGLGLAITQRLVALMGGEIHVDSAPGEGATFTVTVPVGPVGTNGSPSTATGEGAVDWTDGPCRVLVVDDRPEVGIIVEEFLDDCAVTAVTSAAEALAHVPDAEPFDVFLVDIQLGEQASGIDLLPDLQSRPGAAAASAPVVAITAHSLPGDRQRFLDEGFDGYLGKPFTRSDLRSTIQQALGSHSTPTR